MDASRRQFYLIIFFTTIIAIETNHVRPKCPVTEKICEFWLTLGEYRMMTLVQDTSKISFIQEPAVFSPDGSAIVRDRRKCQIERNITTQEISTIPTGDGSFKEATLFNRTLPGPPIIVYRGQQVVVHVTNNLVNEGTTIHWHGIKQRNSPWMDGVAGVSQCPINPGETFTYRFMAEDVGTHWYHSHYGTQRTMGAHGPLIILEKTVTDEQNNRGEDPIPQFDDEFYMVVSDFFERSSKSIAQLVQTESVSYYNGWTIPTRVCYNSTKQSDGVDCGVVPFQSGLINGKGRRYNEDDLPMNLGIPLEKFTVSKGKKYRFRLICASMTFAFRVSIDGHTLNVIASDGNDLKGVQAESIIVSSGERYDFWIEANDADGLGNYWIRAETLEMYQNDKLIMPNHVEAVLHYEGTAGEEPTSQKLDCSKDVPCIAINCPYQNHHSSTNISCVNVVDLENTKSRPEFETLKPAEPVDIQEHFLNFHFTWIKGSWKTTVNGIQHRHHAAPPQIYPDKEKQGIVPCDKNNCVDNICMCTHLIDVPIGKIVQLVLFITINNPVGVLNGNPHNVHLHGHSYQVVKVGYPTYNASTGFYQERNHDIRCVGEFCNKAAWSNSSWMNGNVPGLLEAPPLKDTVFVPVGGYVVIRFKADNPGYWYMHCHTEFHNEEGMAVLFKAGNDSEMNEAPKEMSQCGNTHVGNKDFLRLMKTPRSLAIAEDSSKEDGMVKLVQKLTIYQTLTVVFATLSISLFVANLALWLSKAKQHSGYIPIPSTVG